jgi:adenosylcobinamide kinase/adenosylcobinamide-phosphate guanylyltransferase
MEMIIGGAYQGKYAYACAKYPQVRFQSGAELTEEELFQAQGVRGFHAYIRKEMEKGTDVMKLAGRLIERNPDIILISDELGYGVVPVNAFDRAYREAVGRICTELAAFSTKVTRVALGIGTVIKDA